jgi:hypothetical protein
VVLDAEKEKMEHPPWEVLSLYAARYRIPRRRPDSSLKEEAELADEILGYENALYKLDYGCFYERKLGHDITVREVPLKLYPREQMRKRFTETSWGSAPAPLADSQSAPLP